MTAPATAPLAPIDWRNLVRAGEDLLNLRGGGSRPTNEHIRRAVSNAYYALFHALAASNADVLVGELHDALTAEAWYRAYRGLDHSRARRELQQHRGELSAESQNFVDMFSLSQERRHLADYDPGAVFTVQQTAIWLAIEEYTCAQYLEVDAHERTCIAILTTVERRRERA